MSIVEFDLHRKESNKKVEKVIYSIVKESLMARE
jgi:hypothetical protein